MKVLASGWRFLFLSFLSSLWVTDCQRGPAKLWADCSVLDWGRPKIPKLCCSLEGHGELKKFYDSSPLSDSLTDEVKTSQKGLLCSQVWELFNSFLFVCFLPPPPGLLVQVDLEQLQERSQKRKKDSYLVLGELA